MTRINNGEINMKGTGIRFNGGSALLNKYEGLTVLAIPLHLAPTITITLCTI